MTAIPNSADWAGALHSANRLLAEKEQQLQIALATLRSGADAASDLGQHQESLDGKNLRDSEPEAGQAIRSKAEDTGALQHQLEERHASLQAALATLVQAQLELAAIHEGQHEPPKWHQRDTDALTAGVTSLRLATESTIKEFAAVRSANKHLLQQHQLDVESGDSAIAAARQAVAETEAAHAQALEGHRIELNRLQQDLVQSEQALGFARSELAFSARDRTQFSEERSELQRALELAQNQRDRAIVALDTLQSAHEKQIEGLHSTIEFSNESRKQSQAFIASMSARFEAQRVELEELLSSSERLRGRKQLELDRALQEQREVEQRLLNTQRELSEALSFRQKLTSDLELAEEQARLQGKWHESLRLQEQELRREAQQALTTLREVLEHTRLQHKEANQVWQHLVERECRLGQDEVTALNEIHDASVQHAQERYESLLIARAQAQQELAEARKEVNTLRSALDAATHHWTYRLSHWLRPKVRLVSLDQRTSGGDYKKLTSAIADIGSSLANESVSEPQASTVLTLAHQQPELNDATPMKSDPSQPTTVTNIDELLSLYDKEFVEAAYIALLGRPADPIGLSAHVHMIRRGHRPESVITGIARSSEYRERGRRLDGLPELLRMERHSFSNLLSKFVSRYIATSARRNAELMRRTGNDVMRRLDLLTHKVDALNSKVEGLEAKFSAGVTSARIEQPSLVEAPPAAAEGTANVDTDSVALNMNPRAQRLLDEIKNAIKSKII